MATNDQDNLKFLEELQRQSRAEIGFGIGELCRIERSKNWVREKSEQLGEEGLLIAISQLLADDLGSILLANRLLELNQVSAANRLKRSALLGGLQAARKIAQGFAPGNRLTQDTQMPGAIAHVFFPEGIPAMADEQQPRLLRECTVERRVSTGIPETELSLYLARVRQHMLQEAVGNIFQAESALVVDFDFRFCGIRQNVYGVQDRQTEFSPGFPGVDDWKSFGSKWGDWNLLIRLRATELD
jgi:hypothetical protein